MSMSMTEQVVEQYQIAAAEYEIISQLATTDFRRDMYELLASRFRQLAADRQQEGSRMTPTASRGRDHPPPTDTG
jgi:hypothetical protein